jgi:hypothetical protein
MREEGHDVHTWAMFTDVSLHGCYVEATATYPVGTILELKLAVNGLEVQARGTRFLRICSEGCDIFPCLRILAARQRSPSP